MSFSHTSLYAACPHCGALFDRSPSNAFGEFKVWSDDYSEREPRWSALKKCSNCNKYFWLNEVTSDISADPLRSVQDISKLLSALRNGLGNTRERELLIRIKLWWMILRPFGNSFRNISELKDFSQFQIALNKLSSFLSRYLSTNKKKTSPFDEFIDAVHQQVRDDEAQSSKIWRPNLSRMNELLDESIPAERIMKAEICRELEDFSAAKKLLQDFPPEYKLVANKIIRLCNKKKRGISHWDQFKEQVFKDNLALFWNEVETRLSRGKA